MMRSKALLFPMAGFIASLILTLIAYFLIVNPGFFHINVGTVILVILLLAGLQSMIQLIFFHHWLEKGLPWYVGFFISTVGIIFTVVFFSIWIMSNLNYNM